MGGRKYYEKDNWNIVSRFEGAKFASVITEFVDELWKIEPILLKEVKA